MHTNYTSAPHRLTSNAYEGYGIYEFNVPGHWYTPSQAMSQFPSLPGLPSLPSPAEAMASEGGIQVLKSQYRDMAVKLLDQMTFKSDGPESAPVVTGQATIILGTLGSGWASSYLAKGYAILAEISTIESGAPQILMTKNASDIAGNAVMGGKFVVVASPPALLAAAQTLLAKPPPKPPNGIVVPPPIPPPNGTQVQAKTAPTPAWMWPAIVGVGALALVAVYSATKKR